MRTIIKCHWCHYCLSELIFIEIFNYANFALLMGFGRMGMWLDFYFVQYLIDVRNYSISCRASGEHSRVLHLAIQRETHLTYRKQPSRWVCLCVHYAYHIRTYKPLHLPIFIQEAMPLNNHDNSISQQIESLCIGQSTRKKNGTVFWCKNSAIVNIDRYRKTFSRYWHVRTFVCKIQIYGVKQSDDGDGGGG